MQTNQTHLSRRAFLRLTGVTSLAMALLPMLIVFFFAQRLFIQGVVITGVKG